MDVVKEDDNSRSSESSGRRRPDYYLLDQIDTSEQVHSEIDEGPVDTLALVLFLLKYEHVVVKELLQLLVGEVDAQLLETVELLWTKIGQVNTVRYMF